MIDNTIEICCIKGCVKATHALGLCINHWRMNRKHGSPVAERPLSAINRGLTNEERFWKSVDKRNEGECWPWLASKDKDGYGVFRAVLFDRQVHKAHVFSHMLATGEILTDELVIMHSCDNPPCVNPEHLSSGTRLQNTADMIAKGRNIQGRINQSQKVSKLTDDEAIAIIKDPRRYDEIAAAYGIHRQHVLELKARTTRVFLNIDPHDIVRSTPGLRGEERSKNLKEADILDIRASKESLGVLATRYNVSKQTICDIQKFRSWKHVKGVAKIQEDDVDSIEL